MIIKVTCKEFFAYANGEGPANKNIGCKRKVYAFDLNEDILNEMSNEIAKHLSIKHKFMFPNIIYHDPNTSRRSDRRNEIQSMVKAHADLSVRKWKEANPTILIPNPLPHDHDVDTLYEAAGLYHYDDQAPREYTLKDSKCGEIAGESTVTRDLQLLLDFNNASKYEFGKSFYHIPSMDVSSIAVRLKGMSQKRKNQYHFYTKALMDSGESFVQPVIDGHYRALYNADSTILSTLSPQLQVTMQKSFGDELGKFECPGTTLPQTALLVQQNNRKTVMEAYGPFFKLYRSNITITNSKAESFFFVDPVPLCLLNLHHPDMLSVVKEFKKSSTDDAFLMSPNLTNRSKMRVGGTVEDIFKEHLSRTELNVSYKGSVPLVLRVYLDGALVSNNSNLSMTPILVGVENLHPDIQTSLAAKTLTGYYPNIKMDRGKKSQAPTIKQQYWHAFLGDLITVIDTYHDMGGIVVDVPQEYAGLGSDTTSMMSTKFFPYICAFGKLVNNIENHKNILRDCLDIDGPERYKAMCIYKSCPSCVLPVGSSNFLKPLEDHDRRQQDLIMEFYYANEGHYKKNKTILDWKEKWSMRPIKNAMWERSCIPTDVYRIITTDILHGIMHGMYAYVLANQVFIFKRNKLSVAIMALMDAQSDEFTLFCSPMYTIKEGVAKVDVTRQVRLRKLEIELNSTAVNLVSSDAVTTWIHASHIVIGYGDTCALGRKGNDLHHFRMIINLITLILVELQTDDIRVLTEWAQKVNTMVDGLILLFQDPHMYSKEGTEKMHRMRHLVEDFVTHGNFKSPNTAHWEKGHRWFTKWAFDRVGRHGRQHANLPPLAKMILEVYTMFLATFFMRDQGPAPFRPENKKKPVPLNPEESVRPEVTKKTPRVHKVGYVETKMATVKLQESSPNEKVNKIYRTAYQHCLEEVRDGTLDSKDTAPPLLANAKFYKQVYKSFTMTTTLSVIKKDSHVLQAPDKRYGQVYNIEDVVVLEAAPGDTAQFAVIDAIVLDDTGPTSKIFLLLEYCYAPLRAKDSVQAAKNKGSVEATKNCVFCNEDDFYQVSNCIAQECRICLPVRSATYESSDSESSESDDDEGNSKTKNKKPPDHDASMMELIKTFPDLHRIPFKHYHTTGMVDLVEIGNVVTKAHMIRDHRAFRPANSSSKRGFFDMAQTLRNM